MTKAKIQSFCIANNFNIGNFNRRAVYPRSVTEKNETLYS